MIVCSNCGTSNPDDTEFCRKCQAFLAWEGTRVESGTKADDRIPDSADDRTDPVDVVTDPVEVGTVADEASREKRAGGADQARIGATVATDARPAEVDRTAEPQLTSTVAADSVVASPEKAVGDSDGPEKIAARQPDARQPGSSTHRTRVRPVDEPPPTPVTGERPCPKCGRGNDSTRRFCRYCGSSLAMVAEEEQLPWWRRLLERLRRRGKRDRRPTGVARRVIKITAFLCVLAILAVVGPPFLSRGITAVRDRIQPSDPIVPVAVTASSSDDAKTAPERIIDGATNRFWAPSGKAVDAWVEAAFADPVRLTDILIHSGVSTNQEQFLTVGRPHELTLIATTEGGDTVEQPISLRDRPGEQKFKFRASDVTRVRIVIRSTYGPESKPTAALAEVEFFGRT